MKRMNLDKLAKVIHWAGFVISVLVILFFLADIIESLQVLLLVVVGLLPFFVAAYLRGKLTGKKSLWPWANK
ncbi:MAG TPA: hypothetical protein EYG31_13690 [Porticoccaceae bacterium]|nr:hypothetical protein [Gammaproteobacteria bacterium]HIL61674.1 hypothetical protein [Porticoccaceae bacterium]